MNNLDSIFYPKNIAVIGASNRKGSVGYGLFRNLISDFKGKVYPVNPKREKVQGIKAYSSIKQIKDRIDLAEVAVPAEVVPKIITECGQKGVKGCIVVSAGFKEAGSKGKELEKEIKKIVDKFGMALIGPNCLGVINTENNLNASFSAQMPKKGKIVVLSQSGALGSALIQWSLEQNIGMKSFVSVGSMLDVSFADLVQYFGEDPKTNSIVIYMEAAKDPKRFVQTARKFVQKKLIVVFKTGRTTAGKKAIISHTGALAGEKEIYRAAFRQAGILQVDEMSEVFTCLRTLEFAGLPEGPNLAIVTNAGGAGVMAVDAVESEGAKVAPLSKETIIRLDQELHPAWSKTNPIDVLGDASCSDYEMAIKACIEDKKVDGVLVLFTSQFGSEPEETAKVIARASKKYDKPIFSSWIGTYGMDQATRILNKNGVPNYLTPERAVRAFVHLIEYRENLKLLEQNFKHESIKVKPDRKKLRRRVKESKTTILSETESKQFLQEYEIPVVRTYFADTAQKAVQQAQKIGFPIVMKIQSPDITHKSGVGGICYLYSKQQVMQEFYEMTEKVKKTRPAALIEGVSVQKMVRGIDYELILGGIQDPEFGPVVLFGHGGTAVEIYEDKALGFPPLTRSLARRILEDTRIFGFLKQEYQDKKSADIKLLEDILLKFSKLIVDFPEIQEFDVNPLAISKGKPIALDARIVLSKSE